MSRPPTTGTLVLDCAGLSGYLSQDRRVMLMLEQASQLEWKIRTCAATIIEATHPKAHAARMSWVLSRVQVDQLTKESAQAASTLLRQAGLHGHKYAIDSMVAELALRQTGPVTVLTSDVDDMSRLCGSRVRLVEV